MIDIGYDLDMEKFRIFTFNRNIYKCVPFKCQTITFCVPLSIFKHNKYKEISRKSLFIT